MENVSKVHPTTLLRLLVIGSLFAASCTQVYFEKPVPQQGTVLHTVPTDWAGVYIAEPEHAEEPPLEEQLFPQFFRLERISETQLLVSSEHRIHEKELPRLRLALDEQVAEGTLIRYQLSESMILCTVLNEAGAEEQQYTALLKTGSWYLLPQTMAPFHLYDLKAGLLTEFDSDNQIRTSAALLPMADRIETEAGKLAARQNRKGWYFNTQKGPESNWSLLYIEQAGEDRLRIKQSYLENEEAFKKRLDYFNAITPFRETASNNYEIDPSDQALERLLVEDGLFQTTVLRKLPSN
jgi:hypothetical protein